MGAGHRVVVDVHHLRVRRDRLRHLVHAVLGGQAGTEVEELADARLAGQEADHAADERPVVADGSRDVGQGGEQLLRGVAVGGEVVLAAEDVVVDPGDVRRRRINAACRPRAASGQPCHHLGIRVMLTRSRPAPPAPPGRSAGPRAAGQRTSSLTFRHE